MLNYYGALCTEMYDCLHEKAPEDELAFYLSYAKKDMRILEALCGSGRFMIPFIKEGYDIYGTDLSSEMLEKLKQKEPSAKICQADIIQYQSLHKFDYIFITSGSMSLFTDLTICKKVLYKMKDLLASRGVFVFAVDTVKNISHKQKTITQKTKEGYDLVLKMQDHYDIHTQTQYSPSIYELYDQQQLLKKETMDFQYHLYEFSEMEKMLKDVGFKKVKTYASFDKTPASSNEDEMFLFECYL